ncbi:LYR motif-containing protein 5A OS=Danio rerio GN=lyrm5a PE=3 SV=1 [Rhizoctonia solani AG-1 IB]|uniref:LYR motif-containing protein 5A n=1 Tax=Thanatephorus cucumeris (strain AG1-IB / isolate 7/3/14) TaxID=1108050 RepID=A0A0B7FEM3_THACB|nr:LYR motif-containing protein 5A OS=Danio rerio GN=lyrm5a PE=3 SV=1 [Rhizoctonia solani AG-1 IB]
MATQAQRFRAIRLYKELHRLGREYPDPSYDFNGRLRRAYEKNAKLTDPTKIDQMLDLAEFVKKETLALYSLRKYRHIKRSYES